MLSYLKMVDDQLCRIAMKMSKSLILWMFSLQQVKIDILKIHFISTCYFLNNQYSVLILLSHFFFISLFLALVFLIDQVKINHLHTKTYVYLIHINFSNLNIRKGMIYVSVLFIYSKM